ncbi:MAG: putative quinol monooxygenase [Bacteroidia bacterium]
MSIVRIVRMEFREDALEEFHAMFDQFETRIRGAEGCTHLQLYRDAKFPNVRYTYSHWVDEHALDAYRESALFGEVWPRTKKLFAAKPQAFSMVL